jgi:microcystin-dependent protein
VLLPLLYWIKKMPKIKISEFDSTPANNTDIDGINIAEGCAPSGINNAIRELMSQLKDQQTGAAGDPFTVAGNLTSSGTLAITGGLTLDGAAGTTGQVLLSAGSGNTPTWGASFVSGMIMLWSGSIATIPTGWVLCNGSNSTPDLRNRFVIGAHSDNTGVANTTVTGSSTLTGGSKDAVVVSHNHSITDPGHAHAYTYSTVDTGGGTGGFSPNNAGTTTSAAVTSISVNTAGVSGTNENLVPYYALAYIMKT